MIIPDVNLLLYAYNSSSPFHAAAARWWRASLSGKEPVGLPMVVALGFVLVGTNPRVFPNPMPPEEAAGHVRSWLDRALVSLLQPGPDHLYQVLDLLKDLGTAGNLATDAQIAALALEHGGTVHTADSDFVRFKGLRWFNPITGLGSSVPRAKSPLVPK